MLCGVAVLVLEVAGIAERCIPFRGTHPMQCPPFYAEGHGRHDLLVPSPISASRRARAVPRQGETDRTMDHRELHDDPQWCDKENS